MDAKAIRLLDGLALSKLAYDLGLAPEDAVLWPDDLPYANREFWEPHQNLDTAETCFRGLRTRGWDTTVTGTATEGYAMAQRQPSRASLVTKVVYWPTEQAPKEAHALLLVSVLAVASEAPQP